MKKDKKYGSIPNTNDVFIYGLTDPRPEHLGELRYVGQSHVGMKRPRQRHVAKCLNWEKCLKKFGLEKEIFIIDEWDGRGDWKTWLNETEIFYVGYFRMIGCDLTNMTNGGDGGNTGKWSPERRKNTVDKLKEIWSHPEKVEEQRLKLLGKNTGPRPEWVIQNIRKGRAGQGSPWRKGQKHTDEAKKLCGDARRGKKQSPEEKLKRSASMKKAWEEGRHAKHRSVVDEKGRVYASASEASRILNISG